MRLVLQVWADCTPGYAVAGVERPGLSDAERRGQHTGASLFLPAALPSPQAPSLGGV